VELFLAQEREQARPDHQRHEFLDDQLDLERFRRRTDTPAR
jgi:hypothetical protein